jgi:hypothetical protein
MKAGNSAHIQSELIQMSFKQISPESLVSFPGKPPVTAATRVAFGVHENNPNQPRVRESNKKQHPTFHSHSPLLIATIYESPPPPATNPATAISRASS